jgi:hypothetical protein
VNTEPTIEIAGSGLEIYPWVSPMDIDIQALRAWGLNFFIQG